MGWSVRLFRAGPVSYTWHPKRRRRARPARYSPPAPYWSGLTETGERCPHHHRSEATAGACSQRAARRAARGMP